MKIYYLILIFTYVYAAPVVAQTKLIAHKSHSGSAASFKVALEGNLFDIAASNFGGPSLEFEREMWIMENIDSIIYVNDSCVVKVATNYLMTNYPDTTLTQVMERDTVFNKPEFSKRLGLDSIKSNLRNDMYLRDRVDSIKFIGFEDPPVVKPKQGKDHKDNFSLPFGYYNGKAPFGGFIYVWLGLIALFSFTLGIINLRFSQAQKAK